MSERIHVTLKVDTDELRKWADKHADSGNHGVAHVLYKAASDGESLSEQAIREAKADAWDAAVRSLVYEDGTPVDVASSTNPYRDGAQ